MKSDDIAPSGVSDKQNKSYSNLVSNSRYLFVIIKNEKANDLLSNENLLYIDQYTSSEKGMITAEYPDVSTGSYSLMLFGAGKTITDHSTPTKHTIFFAPGDWNSKNATQNGWSDSNSWGSKKTYGTKLSNGTFESFEFDMPENHDIIVMFMDPDTKKQTFACYLDSAAYGDTARRTGKLYINDQDDERFDDEVKFDRTGYTCPLTFHFTGVVQGTMLTKYMVPAEEVANYIYDNQYSYDMSCAITTTKIADGIKKFGTTAKAVYDAYMKLYANETYAKRLLFPENYKNEKKYTYYCLIDPDIVGKNVPIYAIGFYSEKQSDSVSNLYEIPASSYEMKAAPKIGKNVYQIELPAFANEVEFRYGYIGFWGFSSLDGYKDGSPYDSSIKTNNFDGWVYVRNDAGYDAWFTKDNYMNYMSYDYFNQSDYFDAILGDLDGDNTITSADALTVLRASVGLSKLTSDQTILADIDNDGTITSGDALAVLRCSVGLSGNDKIGKPIAA